MRLAKPVNFAGRLYMPGENVKGVLPLDYLELLQASGFISESDDQGDPGREDDISTEEPLEATANKPSVEEFRTLKANEQKEVLDRLGIEAASNPDKRAEQYRLYLESDKDDQDAGV